MNQVNESVMISLDSSIADRGGENDSLLELRFEGMCPGNCTILMGPALSRTTVDTT